MPLCSPSDFLPDHHCSAWTKWKQTWNLKSNVNSNCDSIRIQSQVDCHIHAASSMNQKHLLRFMKKMLRVEPDSLVCLNSQSAQGGQSAQPAQPLTLQQVFEKLGLTIYDLNIDACSDALCFTLHSPLSDTPSSLLIWFYCSTLSFLFHLEIPFSLPFSFRVIFTLSRFHKLFNTCNSLYIQSN